MPERSEVTFPSGGEVCAAYLYRPGPEAPPAAADGRRGCVIIAHGFTGTRDDRLPAFAERFSAAGFVALVFDYRHFGASSGEPRQLLDVGRQHDDYRAAMRFARGLEGVDPDRIALWGSSFSGGHVLALGATEAGVAAIVAQAPFTDGIAATKLVPPRTSARLTAAALRDVVGGGLGRPAHTVPAVGRPGELAVMTAPEAWDGMAAMTAGDSRWENAVAARLLLTMPLYRPGASADRVRAPLLVCVCDEDQTTPPGPAARVAARAPRGEAVHYPIGHFAIYEGAAFDRAVGDQIAFLRRHLG
jgi:dienelactone hydrolase